MDRQRLTNGVKLIAFGYILLHLNLNLGTINILPNWLGYILILRSLPVLREYEQSAILLRPICILLALWEGVLWIEALLGFNIEGYLISIIATVVALYFHFQLLTNLADIAKRFNCVERRHFLTLRTVRTVMITIFALPVPWENYQPLTIGMIAAYVIVAVWICVVLFLFRRSLALIPEVEQGG